MRATHKAGIADKAAEHRICNPCHGGKNSCRGNAYRPNLERVRHLRALRCDSGIGRVFPEFLHCFRNWQLANLWTTICQMPVALKTKPPPAAEACLKSLRRLFLGGFGLCGRSLAGIGLGVFAA